MTAPYVVLSPKIERGSRAPDGGRMHVYRRGDPFPKVGDVLKESEEAQLLAKRCIAKSGSVSSAAIESANYLSEFKRELDRDQKTEKADDVKATIQDAKEQQGIKMKVEAKK